jgi:hypothetical protein
MSGRKSVDAQQEVVEDVDTALKGLPLSAESAMPPALAALSDEEYARVGRSAVWKLDLRVMPAVSFMYVLNYLDRQNIASAKLANIVEDLHMTSVQFQTCVSLLFVGYSTFQSLALVILSRFNIVPS